jgi:hypothetical protein
MEWSEIYNRLYFDREDREAWEALRYRVQVWACAHLRGRTQHNLEDVVADTCSSVAVTFRALGSITECCMLRVSPQRRCRGVHGRSTKPGHTTRLPGPDLERACDSLGRRVLPSRRAFSSDRGCTQTCQRDEVD